VNNAGVISHYSVEVEMAEDAVTQHLSLIARLLEAAGYAIEVDYATAAIIVWLDEWPVVVEVKRNRS
jgi:hypothetical protein